jgi:hypothetical protein
MSLLKTISLLDSIDDKDKRLLLPYLKEKKGDSYTLLKFIAQQDKQKMEPNKIKQILLSTKSPVPFADDKSLRYALSNLNANIESYIATQELEKDKSLKAMLLKKYYATHGKEKYFLQFHRESEKVLQQSGLRDAAFYHEMYEHESQKLTYYYGNKPRNEKNNMEQVLESLDKFYLSKKLSLAAEVVNIRNVLKLDYQVFMIDEILSYLEKHPYRKEPCIAIYYYILRSLQDPDDEKPFDEIQQLLKLHRKKFGQLELLDIYQFLQNYFIKRINLGDKDSEKSLFENYKQMLSLGLLTLNGEMSQWNYKNISTIGLRLKEYDWVMQFISQHKRFLDADSANTAYAYNMANVLFRKEKFDDALKLLQQVNLTDVYYKLDARTMMMKIYYEMSYEESLLYMASSFKKFLSRDRLISPYQKEIYGKFIAVLRKMNRAKRSKRKSDALSKEVAADQRIAEYAWIKEKLNIA